MTWHLSVIQDGDPKYPKSLTEEEINSFINLRNILFFELSSEEMFDVVLSNYEDFYSEISNIGNEYIIRIGWGATYATGSRHRTLINKRTLNVLAACNAYLDFRLNGYSNIFGKNSQEFILNKKITGEMYEANSEYRICYKLRNFIMHHGFPISLNKAILEKQDINRNEITSDFKPCLERDKLLKANDAWNQATIADLNACKETIEIFPLITKYVSNIVEMHNKLKLQTKENVESLQNICSEWVEIANAYLGKDKSLISLVSKTLSEQIESSELCKVEWVPIDALERLQELRSVNGSKGKFSNISNISTLTPFLKGFLKDNQNHKRDLI